MSRKTEAFGEGRHVPLTRTGVRVRAARPERTARRTDTGNPRGRS
jgi:hypothetical protein